MKQSVDTFAIHSKKNQQKYLLYLNAFESIKCKLIYVSDQDTWGLGDLPQPGFITSAYLDGKSITTGIIFLMLLHVILLIRIMES